MQSLNIFLTKHYINSCYSDVSPLNRYQEITDQSASPVDLLDQFLTTLPESRNTNLNFILDQSLLGFFYFKLPLLNRRKIFKILEFELEDTVLTNGDDYYFDYYFKINKEDAYTEVGVYTIEKELLHNLTQLCKSHNLGLHWVLSLNNLIDLELRRTSKPENRITVSIEEKIARIFVYKNSFLIGTSIALYPVIKDDPHSSENFNDFLKIINQKIAAISLEENDLFNVSILHPSSSFITVDEQQKLVPKDFPNENLKIPIVASQKLVHRCCLPNHNELIY